MMSRNYYNKFEDFTPENVVFTIGQDSKGKPSISMHYQPALQKVALVTPPCVTMWPRVSGDGNFGTMWGPSDITKAKFTLDLSDASI